MAPVLPSGDHPLNYWMSCAKLEPFDGEDLARRRRTRSERLASGVDPVNIVVEAHLEMADLGGRVFAMVRLQRGTTDETLSAWRRLIVG